VKERTALYPAVQFDAVDCGVVTHAGGVALLESARAAGLDRLLREQLALARAAGSARPGKGPLHIRGCTGSGCVAGRLEVAVVRG